mgnify:CR=1 FL=1
MRIKLIAFLLLIRCWSYSQSCAPGGTVFTSITGTMNLCPAPPPFITMLHYEVCTTGIVTDTCGGNATRYYFINTGGDVTLKAFQNSFIQVKSGGKLNIVGGANLIYVEAQPGSILTGLPAGTVTSCPSLPPPNGATCYVSSVRSAYEADQFFSVFPNPFSNKITIRSVQTSQSVQIFNVLGKLISKHETEQGKIEIDLSKEPDGIYFVKIGSVSRKVVKE